MGNSGSYSTTSTWGNGETYWIYRASSSDYWYKIEKKEDKGFIKESEFKV